MSRYARKRSDPPVKPVKHIEVTDKNRKLKLVLIVILLALGVTLIATAIAQLLVTPAGWETIQVETDADESCAGDFIFQYLLGGGDQAAPGYIPKLHRMPFGSSMRKEFLKVCTMWPT